MAGRRRYLRSESTSPSSGFSSPSGRPSALLTCARCSASASSSSAFVLPVSESLNSRLEVYSQTTDPELSVQAVKSDSGWPMLGPQPTRPEQMNQPADNSHYVKRVVLPSGRAIEVVYFDSSEAAAPAAPADGRDLHICPECDRDLVYPVEWEEASATHWEVLLRCPNCEWSEVDVFDQDTVDRFDLELDRGTEHVMRDLKRLVQANMEEEVERFAKALDSDAIWPMDF